MDLELYKLYFEHVHYSKLKRQKYLIIFRTEHYVVKYVGWFVEYELTRKILMAFQNVTCFYWEQPRNVLHHYSNRTPHTIPYMYFDNNSVFFEMIPQKQRIQECMEHRALLKILRRLIGDETFYW
jgi:hypothetical protein